MCCNRMGNTGPSGRAKVDQTKYFILLSVLDSLKWKIVTMSKQSCTCEMQCVLPVVG